MGCGGTADRPAPSDVFTPARNTTAAAVRDFFNVRPIPEQPIPFPHKRHIEKKLMCTDYCHESVERGRLPGIPSVKTCMNLPQPDCGRPAVDQGGRRLSRRRHRNSVAARLRLHARVARTLQPRAAHPRQAWIARRVTAISRSRRVAERDVDLNMGFCVELPPEQKSVERLPHVPLLRRRSRTV